MSMRCRCSPTCSRAQLKVDYGAQGQRVYNKGDSFIEADQRQPHNGENMGPRGQ